MKALNHHIYIPESIHAAALVIFATSITAIAKAAGGTIYVEDKAALRYVDAHKGVWVLRPTAFRGSGYDYPVLYLHDAQNLFDPKQSYTGATWQITEAMQRLRETVGFEAIVVGIEHGGPRRVSELTPWPIENFVGDTPPAEGAAYLRWIVEVVKPYIDANYPTKPECEHTAMIGSSLGGLLTHYAAHAQPGVFCKVGILSPSYWVSEGPYSFARQQPAPATVRVFMYAGGKGSPRMVPDAQRMLRLMQTTRPAGSATTLVITPEAGHNEPAWAAAFPQAVRWLFELPADTGAAVATPTSRTASPSTAPSPPAAAPAQSAPAHVPGPAAPAR